jgi:hypothetical protein
MMGRVTIVKMTLLMSLYVYRWGVRKDLTRPSGR